MKKINSSKLMKRFVSLTMTFVMVISCISTFKAPTEQVAGAVGDVTTSTLAANDLLNNLMEEYTSFIYVRHKQLGGSHYAYTEGLSDELINTNSPDGVEANFDPGSQIIKLELSKSGSTITRKETVLLESADGVLRDPDVSEDGTKFLFSWKKNRTDDYHLYEYDLKTNTYKQLTFGSGSADFEPKYLPNGKIVFSSTRIIQTVDCWITPVSNNYVCDADGKNITRLGYDQVHTTYPTVTSDGRVLYTRWDYNDRNQMYIQAVFQMFQDGTNQTEVYGGNSNFPCTLLHTREIPGTTDKYISIASGHHTYQAGKLVVVDTSVGRNSPDSIDFVVDDGSAGKTPNVDAYGQSGALYKYPIAVNDNLFISAYCKAGWSSDRRVTPFGINLFDANGNTTELVSANGTYPASQIVPITERVMFERASMVNYAKDTGTYYVANVYAGEGMEGATPGIVEYLRVVALDYRSYAIGATIGRGTGTSDPYTPIATGNGAWDVKRVLGIVPVEEDGSALFSVPSETPVYFQLLDKNGDVIQSMRTWSTLMPGETFSCVGCHEDKNTIPPAASTTTMAMAKGVQKLQKDLWMTGEYYEDYDPYEDSKGFDYLEEVQPIFDESCIKCHNNTDLAYELTNASAMEGVNVSSGSEQKIFGTGETWKYYMSSSENVASGWQNKDFDDSGWASAQAPFGDRSGYKTSWTGDTNYIWIRKSFNITNVADYEDARLYLNTFYDDNPQFYLNGQLIYTDTEGDAWVDGYTKIGIGSEYSKYLVEGTNVIAIRCSNATGGRQIDTGLSVCKVERNQVEVMPTGQTWKYYMSTSNNVASGWQNKDFNDSGWASAQAPFGDRENYKTFWGDSNKYIWIRRAFTINNVSDYKNYRIKLNTFYDDNPQFYINGNLVYTDTVGNAWVDGYTEFTLDASATKYLVEGTNVIAIQCSNDAGGRQIDTGISLVEYEGDPVELLGTRATGWKYVINNTPANNWMNEDFNDSSWNTGNAPFGSINSYSTYWGGDNSDIWLRKTFTINDYSAIEDMKMYLNIFYDEDPTVYINGNKIFSASGYLTDYNEYALMTGYTEYLKQGTNTIAIHAHNSTGGLYIDAGLSMKNVVGDPVSLEGINVNGARMKKNFPLSYLLLTGSTPSGRNWLGNSVNNYTNWISSMSQCEVLDPYQFGAANSNIISLLRAGHGDLTDEEIRTIATWIDLGVPAYGTYDANNTWAGNGVRWAEQYTNKREFFDMLNEYSGRTQAGLLDDAEINVKYVASGGSTFTESGKGFVTLYANDQYSSGDKVTITLPAGEKYVMVALNSMMGEELVYVPNGTFTFTVPSNVSVYPPTFTSNVTNTITARIPSDEELTESRNLAQNIYDLNGNSGNYPHATAKTQYNNDPTFFARNAIDGFTANDGHGAYPYQSWGPRNDDGYQWIKVDFGREVYVDQVDITIRADFPHDCHYTKATLEFSNGSTKSVNMTYTDEAQTFKFNRVKTSYVIVKDLVPADSSTSVWPAISEVEAYGVVQESIADTSCNWSVDEDNALIYNIPQGTSVEKFKAGFATDTVVYKNGQEATTGVVGTGMTVNYLDKTYTIVVKGDVEGDGVSTVTDVVKLLVLIKADTATQVQIKAGDLNGDGYITGTDVSQMRSNIMDN